MPEVDAPDIRLLVIDDHAMFRDAVAEKLGKEPDMTVVGRCGSAAEALRLLETGVQPSIILLDFDLGPEPVLDFLRDARRQGFRGRVLVVTAGVSGQEAIRLIQAGVQGILHKHHTPDTLSATIRRIAAGEVFLEKTYLGPVFHNMDQSQPREEPKLTERDKAILRFLFEGLSNKEIAARLQLSESAVKASVSHLFQKLGVRTRAQLVKVALEQYSDQL